MILDPVTNFGKVRLTTGYAAGVVTVVLQAGDGALLPDPSARPFNLTWYNATDYPDPTDDPDKEISRCIAKSGDTLTLLRAQEGTAAVAHNTAGKSYKMILSITKKTMDDIETALTAAAVSGTIITITSGTVDDANLIFGFAQKPKFVVVGPGNTMRENHGWSWDAGTLEATLINPVGSGNDIYGIL